MAFDRLLVGHFTCVILRMDPRSLRTVYDLSMPSRVGRALLNRLGGSLLLLAASPLFFAGCAVGNRGLVLAEVTPATGGWVLHVYSLGVIFRPTLDDDPGLGFGFSRRSYLFASDEVPPPRAGWHVFGVGGVPYDRAALRQATVVGVNVRTGSPLTAVTVGFEQLTMTQPFDMAGDTFRALRYVPAAPHLSCVSLHMEERC